MLLKPFIGLYGRMPIVPLLEERWRHHRYDAVLDALAHIVGRLEPKPGPDETVRQFLARAIDAGDNEAEIIATGFSDRL